MKALRLYARGDLRLHEEREPTAGAGELVVRVSAVGLCGSDRLWLSEGGIGDTLLERPLILGHEIAGVVESGPRSGERVALDPAIPCGSCPTCLSGNPHLCPEVRFAGHGSTDGALRPLMAWPERLAHSVPDSLSDPEAALLEPLGVALHALDLARVEPGMSAGVFGCGPIGLLIVQLLSTLEQVLVLATDRLHHRVAAAQAFGATVACGADELPHERAFAALLAERSGLDIAFEVAGDDEALEAALSALRPGGRLVVVGIPARDRISFTASTSRRKGVTIAFCRRMTPKDLPRAIELAGSGRVALGPLVSGLHSLEGWQDAFLDLNARRGLNVIVEPQRATIGAAA